MRKLLVIIALGAGLTVAAQPKSDLRPNETVMLYADEFTDMTDPVRAGKITPAGFEMAVDNEITEGETISANGTLRNVGKFARFDLYFPETPNGQMVIVCPGGGYLNLSSYNGVYVAEWMLERGITVAVLKYRLPNRHDTVPLDDAQNTLRYCRAHAEEWGVKTIGVIGFSAGGYLAGAISTLYVDAVTRPDFAILVYPVVVMDEITEKSDTRISMFGSKAESEDRHGKSWEEWDNGKREYKRFEQHYSLEKQVTPDTPPAFIAVSSDDDNVNPENSIRYYTSLLRNGVSAELHAYPYGGHGWGFASQKHRTTSTDKLGYCRDEFYASLDRWLASLQAQE